MEKTAFSVTRLNQYIAAMFKNDYLLHAPVWVQGEVSQCSEHRASGAVYFTIKDENSVLNCVMFKQDRSKGLHFKLETGQKILVCGNVTVYEKQGKYQLIARQIRLDGIGRLFQEYLQIRSRLEELGMFSPIYKQPIPRHAETVGVITSASGSVVWDVIHVAKQRNPGIRILVYPAKVEGDGAAQSLIMGLQAMERAGVDVIIIGRGGGSLEELWPFNDEALTRAIFDCTIPVISAVGHETNMMMSDLVADLHENAPSTAAVKAVTDMRQVLDDMELRKTMLGRLMQDRLTGYRHRLQERNLRIQNVSPEQTLRRDRMHLQTARSALQGVMEKKLAAYMARISVYGEKLQGLSPYEKLAQGYAFVTDSSGSRVSMAEEAKADDKLTVRFSDGAVLVRVLEIQKDKNSAEDQP